MLFSKKTILALASTVALGALMAAIPTQAYASGDITVTDSDGAVLKTVSVSDGDVTAELNSALACAKAYGDYQTTTVTVPAGSYIIAPDPSVRIYSNTTLVCTGATFSCNAQQVGLMLEASHFSSGTTVCKSNSSCKHGGYTQFHDITIIGGTWDGTCNQKSTLNNCGLLFQHGSNVTLNGCTLKNFTNHAVNIAGTQNDLVTNCTFMNSIKYTGTSTSFWGTTKWGNIDRIRATESVHTDFTQKGSEGTAYPLDSTPCKNVTVTNCTFNNTYSGVGTHHESAASKMSGIKVSNCTFKLKDGNAVNIFACSSATITNCTSTGGAAFLRADMATVSVSNCKANNCTGNAIAGVVKSKMTVKNCTVNKAKAAGIMYATKASGSVTGCTVVSSKKGTGINVSGAKATISSSKVSGGVIGIAFKKPTGAVSVKKCTVKGVKGNGIYVYVSKKGKAKVISNTVTGATAAAVRVDKSTKVTVSKNKLNSSRFCVSVSASKNVKGSKNKFSGKGKKVFIVKSSKTSVKGK